MEPRMNRAVITAAEPAASMMQEQGVELDYVLPDYYPDVCKLVKCLLLPTVVSETLNGGRLSYELRVEVRILYCSEDSHVLQCVTQVLRFPRTADLLSGDSSPVEMIPACDYVNCRAVSRRRLDVRGAVTVRIRSAAVHQQEVLSDVFDKSIQLRRIPVQHQAKRLSAQQTIVLSEELELGTAKPPVLHVVRYEARTVDQTMKRVSGKLMVQGNLQLQLLYACEKDGGSSLEPMAFRLPYSQILDMDGLEETDDCQVQCRVIACDLKPVSDADGDVRQLRCEAELRVNCTAVRIASESLVCDAFSTEHPCNCQHTELTTCGAPVPFQEMLVSTVKLSCADEEIDCVYDAWCDVQNLTTTVEDGSLVLSGMLCCNVLVRESSGMPRLLEKEEPFEHRFSVPELQTADLLQVNAFTENCAYTLGSASEVTLKAELCMEGTVTHCRTAQVLTGVEVLEEEPVTRQYALKLYFGKVGEPVWDIAKRCCTSVEAIMEENELTQETLAENGMLLIPIVG